MLEINLNQVLESIKHNTYSSAIIHYLSQYSNNDDLKQYLALVKDAYRDAPSDKLKQIDATLKGCKNQGIKYLLLSYKLGMARLSRKRSISKKLYLKLIKEYDHIPVSCRKAVARELNLYSSYNYAKEVKIFRTWSQKHLKDAFDNSFNTLQEAVKLFSSVDEKTSDAFHETFQEALSVQQPYLILTALNNAVYLSRKQNFKKAVQMVEKLGYYSGYYANNSHLLLIKFDTIMTVSKMNNDYENFFEAANIANYIYEKMIKPIPNLKKTYYRCIRFARKYALVQKKKPLKNNEVMNNKAMRNFLNGKIVKPNAFAIRHGLSHASIYRILHGERKTVKISTLKKIVSALDLEYSFKNPREINSIIKKMKEEQLFEGYLKRIRQLTDSEFRYFILRAIFKAPSNNGVDYAKLFSLLGDRDTLLEYVGRDFSGKAFVSRCFNESFSFYRGRSELLKKLFEVCGKEQIEKLISLYTSLKSNDEIELFSRFLREYTWGLTVKADFNKEEILSNRFSDPYYQRIVLFCNHMKLSVLDVYLCTWFFEIEEREKLINFFTLKTC